MNLIADRIGLLEPIQETEMLMCSAHESILGDREMSVWGWRSCSFLYLPTVGGRSLGEVLSGRALRILSP